MRALLLVLVAALSGARRPNQRGKPAENKPRDHYTVLGIKPSASADEVKKAYKSKALETHPDKVDKTKVDAATATARWQEVADAHETLSDPQKRRHYDQTRHMPNQNRGGHQNRGGPQGFSGFHNHNQHNQHQQQRQRAHEQQRQRDFHERARRPQPPPPLPPDVERAIKAVSRVGSLSTLRSSFLDPDTGTLRRHHFHAFYTSGECEDRLNREARFPFPFVDPEGADAQWASQLRFAKTDMSPNTFSHADAKKLAEKLGVPDFGANPKACPHIIFAQRGSPLRAKEITARKSFEAKGGTFEAWTWPLLALDRTWRNDCTAPVNVFWHHQHIPAEDGGETRWAMVAFSIAPGASMTTRTFPTHVFSATFANAHSDADAGRDKRDEGKLFAMPSNATLRMDTISIVVDEVFSIRPRCVDNSITCRRKGRRGQASAAKCSLALERLCPRTCGACADDPRPTHKTPEAPTPNGTAPTQGPTPPQDPIKASQGEL